MVQNVDDVTDSFQFEWFFMVMSRCSVVGGGRGGFACGIISAENQRFTNRNLNDDEAPRRQTSQ